MKNPTPVPREEEWAFTPQRLDDEEWFQCLLYEYAREVARDSTALQEALTRLLPIPSNYEGEHCGDRFDLLRCMQLLGPKMGAPFLHRELLAAPWLGLSREARRKRVSYVKECRDNLEPEPTDKRGRAMRGFWIGGDTVRGEVYGDLREALIRAYRENGCDSETLVFGDFVIDLAEPDSKITALFEHELNVLRRLRKMQPKNSKTGKSSERSIAEKGLKALAIVRLKRGGLSYPEIGGAFESLGQSKPYQQPSEFSIAKKKTFLQTMGDLYSRGLA